MTAAVASVPALQRSQPLVLLRLPLLCLLTSLLACGLRLPTACFCLGAEPVPPFAIEVVDASTGRGVPLVELETLNHLRWVTDSNGLIAIQEPELFGLKVYFTIRSHGYEFPPDGFGFRGQALQVVPGGSVQLKVKRINLAERLYRLTGSGIDRDTFLLGRKTARDGQLVRAEVFGCDSVLSAVYRDRIYWFWGDTTRPHYPIGANFHTSGATSLLPANGGLSPDRGVRYDYFVDSTGAVRALAKMPGEGPTWISALTVLKDAAGQEKLYANYVKVRNQLESYRWGFVVWNDERAEFEQVQSFEQRPTLFCEPQSHAFTYSEQEKHYIYFANPLPMTRVLADPSAFVDPTQYECYTCLRYATQPADKQLERDASGRLVYAWKRQTPALTSRNVEQLVKSGLMQADESPHVLYDLQSGRAVQMHSGSVAWNAYRQRWVLIAVEQFGESSLLGEVWYAEADEPTGPWEYARKILTHDQYSFYNPKHHAFFDQDGGRLIYFEGTYTHTFSGNRVITPRYDYNQMLYRLDLSRPELNLPAPFVSSSAGRSRGSKPADSSPVVTPPFARRQRSQRGDFFAWESPAADRLPLSWNGKRCLLKMAEGRHETTLFYALPPTTPNDSGRLTDIYEFYHAKSDSYAYSLDPSWHSPGFHRADEAICRVWKGR